MKKLIAILLLTATFSFGQIKKSDFEGYWEPIGNTYVNVSFWTDENNNIKTKKCDSRDGEILHILSISLSNNEITVESLCESNQWYSVSVYSIDKYNKLLKCSTTNVLGTYESYYKKNN